MSGKIHYDQELITNFFIKVHEFFHIKFISGLILSGLCWAFDYDFGILIVMFTLIMIDTITGVWYAIKTKTVKSRGFYRVAIKMTMYFIMLLVASIVDKFIPLNIAFKMLQSFLVITEAISIFENIGKLGFPVPTVLLSKLADFKDKK